jgi:hypothetical protein
MGRDRCLPLKDTKQKIEYEKDKIAAIAGVSV